MITWWTWSAQSPERPRRRVLLPAMDRERRARSAADGRVTARPAQHHLADRRRAGDRARTRRPHDVGRGGHSAGCHHLRVWRREGHASCDCGRARRHPTGRSRHRQRWGTHPRSRRRVGRIGGRRRGPCRRRHHHRGEVGRRWIRCVSVRRSARRLLTSDHPRAHACLAATGHLFRDGAGGVASGAQPRRRRPAGSRIWPQRGSWSSDIDPCPIGCWTVVQWSEGLFHVVQQGRRQTDGSRTFENKRPPPYEEDAGGSSPSAPARSS